MAILINQPTVTPALGLKKGSSISRPMPLPTVAGIGSMSFPGTAMRLQGALGTNFSRNRLLVQHDGGLSQKEAFNSSNKAQDGLIGKDPKWWEKGVQPNMKEVTSAQDLVDSLLNAGEKLVVVDFYSPGCGGCKALHPKICQLAEMNPDVQFLSVNYEERKAMCHSLNVHVLPFFRFYRGAQGRVCSFSCTNATIKKFKDALAKHSPDRCSLGPAKGLEEKELLALAANKDLNFNYTPTSVESTVGDKEEQEPKEDSSLTMSLPLPSALSSKTTEETFKALAAAQR